MKKNGCLLTCSKKRSLWKKDAIYFDGRLLYFKYPIMAEQNCVGKREPPGDTAIILLPLYLATQTGYLQIFYPFKKGDH